jgi:hypothetical protein
VQLLTKLLLRLLLVFVHSLAVLRIKYRYLFFSSSFIVVCHRPDPNSYIYPSSPSPSPSPTSSLDDPRSLSVFVSLTEKMLAKSLAILFLAQLAVAQTATSSAPPGRGTDLPELVKDVDSCVLGCVRKVASQVNCDSSDLTCLCSKSPSQFRSVLEPCIGEDGCDFLKALGMHAPLFLFPV